MFVGCLLIPAFIIITLKYSAVFVCLEFPLFSAHSRLSFDIWHASGISDVAEAYQAAIKAVTTESQSVVPHASSVQEKANAFSENLRADQTTAVCKIQEGMQFLAHVLISTSMNAA
ncbi:hypothetical protein V8G54_015269 [Vigna mungo]|uniref:DUF7798 domain-containing protein n=1 Tax=Vigna mungo TaxID=3915 RepID=A0AAQ3NI89_VIGMU